MMALHPLEQRPEKIFIECLERDREREREKMRER